MTAPLPDSLPSTSLADLALLVEPALARCGEGYLGADARTRLQHALAVASAALADLLAVPLHGEAASAAAAFSEPAFGVVLELPPDGRPAAQRQLTIAFDAGAARALCDRVQEQLCGLRGVGPLTPAEVGMLEYLTLVALDRVRESLGPAVLIGVWTAAEAPPPDSYGAALQLSLRVGARAGRVVIFGPALPFTGQPGRPPLWSPMVPVARWPALTAAFRLAEFTLPEASVAAMAAGDVLMPGVRHLVGAVGMLVTAMGWRLAAATVAADTPQVTTIQVASPQPVPAVRTPPPEGHRALAVDLGHVTLAVSALRGWQSGQSVDLAKPNAAALRVVIEDGPVWAAEPVIVEGELGLRLIRPLTDVRSHRDLPASRPGTLQ